jgi:sec-independent protein translocase protein TatA
MFGGLGFPELIVILVIAALIFGPGRLPELGEGLGKAIREFQRSVKSAKGELARAEGSGTERPGAPDESSTAKPSEPA